MTHNTGITFELLTQQIFLILVNQESIRNIDVKHDVSLQGMTAKHQIDVYWEFEIGGISYATVIQAKDWNTPLNQGELFKFKCVLNDLPGQPKGIVVTRSGYQSGAEEFAKAHGILLFELIEQSTPPDPPIKLRAGSFAKVQIRAKEADTLIDIHSSDLMRCIRTLVMQIVVFDPDYLDSRFEGDSVWLSQQKNTHGDIIVSEVKNLKFIERPSNLKLYDEALNPVGNVQDIYTSFTREMEKMEVMSQRMTKTFDTATFLGTSSQLLPYIKIKAISSTVTLTAREPILIPLRLANIVNFILKNLNDGTEQLVEIDTGTKKTE
jgi:hypothetical protein